MAMMKWQPSWWNDSTHGASWEKVKTALQRDWEQTKADLHSGGRDLKQGIADTVR